IQRLFRSHQRQPDADRATDRLAGQVGYAHGLGCAANSFCLLLQGRQVRLIANQQKLFTAIACQAIMALPVVIKQCGKGLQYLVPNGVAMLIVDLFEMIQIHQENALGFTPRIAFYIALPQTKQGVTVEQTSKLIMGSLPIQTQEQIKVKVVGSQGNGQQGGQQPKLLQVIVQGLVGINQAGI